MAHINKVIRSFNADGGAQCVDLFARPDAGFGFEEYRRDVEDGRGWFVTGHFGARVYASAGEALEAARRAVPWLDAALPAHPLR